MGSLAWELQNGDGQSREVDCFLQGGVVFMGKDEQPSSSKKRSLDTHRGKLQDSHSSKLA